MRVALVAVGGDAHYFSLLCQALEPRVAVTAICPPDMIAPGFDLSSDIVKLPGNPRGLSGILRSGNPFFLRSVLQTVNAVEPDLVHIVFELRFPALLGKWLHKTYPTVVTVHEPNPFFSASFSRKYIINPMVRINNRALIRWSDKVVVHGNSHMRTLVAKNLPPDKINIVPHGALSFFERWVDSNMKTDSAEPRVLFLGRIWDYKGIDYLLRAAVIIQRERPEAQFVIAGNGDFAPYRSLASQVSNLVLINRFVPDQEVGDLIQKASLLVFPYVSGSQTGWVSAAYSFKKPVVATDTGNFAELVQDNRTGFIVPPRNAGALATAILRLLNSDRLRQEFGVNGHELMVREMSWESVAEKTLQVYRQAIERRRRPGL